MKTHNLGYPRMGSHRQLKRACERYWAGRITNDELQSTARTLRHQHWQLQQEAGIDLIPSNDFSFYDQVLDMTLAVGAVPERYAPLQGREEITDLDLYFAMARGYQRDDLDITAMEMTKWFDTNYHFIVPEFQRDQTFQLTSTKILDEFNEAQAMGIVTKPVIIGPVTYLWLGKEKEGDFHRVELLDRLLPVYHQILKSLVEAGAVYVQLDEPCLANNLSERERQALQVAYQSFQQKFPQLKIILANYFDCYGDNLSTALSLPVHTLHLDLVRCPSQLDDILDSGKLPEKTTLSLGVVDGRNIWKNDYEQSLQPIRQTTNRIGTERVMIAPSCSLLHAPADLNSESGTSKISSIRPWLAFAKQKLTEVVTLSQLAQIEDRTQQPAYQENQRAIQTRRDSPLVHRTEVQQRMATVTEADAQRQSPFAHRKVQQQSLNLPQFPTTTIGSFPQTKEVRQQRAKFKKNEITEEQYLSFLHQETERAIRWQEDVGLDVLVHGEFERNDMVEHFGEQLEGFAFTELGWVQSYGSRCVKPPIIYGDVLRPTPMTVEWTTYAQSLTPRLVKGMLTGPVTILQWSFVRDDQPRATTCTQIALAIRDEVTDLEQAGIRVIQVDEPALREGLPLHQADWGEYLRWAVQTFRLATSSVSDETQIHTHMCYSEFNDIIESIAALDADVITIECSRSQMELLDTFADFQYPNDIGPGVYDIHSPRVPSETEIVQLLEKAQAVLPASQLWVNPDCGLKTRGWNETKHALEAMVSAAQQLRQSISEPV
ncbi:5-methyltetrahydropteroyltriglutamate--homocysteine S-methyltransferase [Tunicatimonas pelagia]|uniref:5-methyltetrahydropteroyltriglutamate-- homocysteine S-methyltransferase n=1 Tax=Tunicatimonas pelagia TaxID=931531 RepID=UPI00266548F1|nr:5-methyltetrahydropteroyltriglutamate--homocysteine S-methyltransferase [Tunicatimonas pelagia]WKN41898.1 5-methyltetrahydropteroyltriglutamate--homocysteine S-methyltransferase [Tunicatimonas pelagia]